MSGSADDLQNSLSQAADNNVLKNIYTSANNPTQLFPLPDVPDDGGSIDTQQPEWRQRVSEQFVVRRQSTKALNQARSRVKKKTGLQLAVRLPKLPGRGGGDSSDPSPPKGPASPRAGKKAKKPVGKVSETQITYQLAPPDPDVLYSLEGIESEKLYVELFDSAEADSRTPAEWVALGRDKYDGKGTPARARFFHNNEWAWTQCRVVGFHNVEGEPVGNYTVEFESPADGELFVKEVKRLSILFDDEDEDRFHKRLSNCKQLREVAISIRRYTKYVEMQDDSLFAPIQQSALHGIVEKLMRAAKKLVLFRQKLVEQLLVEVRAEYGRSMKRAIVDYKRRDPVEEANMASLDLPPLEAAPPVPYSGLVAVQSPGSAPAVGVPRVLHSIAGMHYSRNPGATAVVLALFKSWYTVKQNRFLLTKDLALPMTLFEYQDNQERQFDNAKEKLVLNWRALCVNLIRDKLSDVFSLFVNNRDEYNGSELQRFVEMLTFMLRQQLSEMIVESLDIFRDNMLKYANPQGGRPETAQLVAEQAAAAEKLKAEQPPTTTPEDQMLAQNRASELADEQARAAVSEVIPLEEAKALVGGYLEKPLLLSELDPSRADAADDFINPLFVFQMSTNERKVIFQPELQSVEHTLMRLLNVPNKLHSISQIEQEVVPLLGLPEQPLCTESTIPKVYRHASKTQQEIKTIVRDNLRLPLALYALYASYAEKLDMDATEYAEDWFPTPERLAAKLQAAKEAKQAEAEAAAAREEEGVAEEVVEEDYDFDADQNEEEEAGGKKKLIEDEPEDELHSLEDSKEEIAKFFRYASEIENLSPTSLTFRLIKLELKFVKEHLSSKAREVATKLMKGLEDTIARQSKRMQKEFKACLERLRTPSLTVKALAELKDFCEDIENAIIPRLKNEIKRMLLRMEVLFSFGYKLPVEAQALGWKLQTYPMEVIDALNMAKDQIQIDNLQFQTELEAEQSQFQDNLVEYHKKIKSFKEFGTGSVAQMEQYATEVETLQDKLDKAKDLVKSFNERNVLFGGVPEEYERLNELQVMIEPYYKLWSNAAIFNTNLQNWMTGPFLELDAALITTQVTDLQKLMIRLEKEFNADNATQAALVAGDMRQKITDFKQHEAIIEALRDPGLRPRHWDQISDLLCPGQTPLNPQTLNLAQVLQYDVAKAREDLQEISLAASKEYSLEQQMDKMVGEWKDLNMELEIYKSTGTTILKGSDDIMTLLDDHIMKTQSMRGSPYIKPLEVRCRKWEEKLQLTSKILEEWLQCQKTWIYLEPIFGSEDIMRQMPVEGRRFQQVDTYWRGMMTAAQKTPNCLEFMTETENLLKKLQECNKKLDLIGKGLNEYLETKRLAFPRFYFLSNDELLSILAQTKNALAVQPHLNKCFDALKSLNFSETQIIQGMYSEEGEYVPFHTTVNPNEGAKKGNVELWLKDVEDVIFECVKRVTRRAIGTYCKKDRMEWSTSEPGQVVLSVSQLFFTREVTQALDRNGTAGLKEYLENTMKTQLMALVEAVRGKLTKLNRQTLKALCTIDVHARDVIAKLCDMKIKKSDDFEWLAQLRYYWEANDTGVGLGETGMELDVDITREPDENGFIVDDGCLNVRIVNSHQHYGYEYLGNSDRLVITPLTDRCYRTLMGAVHLHLGGAPEGPAGTGKTETVKDLSKALAIQCIVLNCSDGLTYEHMAKFFKGLAASGAWACFDEFNRIELEVLSVIAQQIGTIQRCIHEGKKMFHFSGSYLPLIHTFSPFITMNPGYAGRAELPDNLKALFRTVAMMIPDYALIAEIVLYSFGYEDASNLARKCVGCLSLSSEQLSSQCHYDFGMRTLFSILSAAGKLKLGNPGYSEDSLCLRGIKDCNVPKFVSADLPLFDGILQDLFPGVEPIESDRSSLYNAMRAAAVELKLQPTDPFIQKTVELFDTFCVRHGLMVVGEAFSGKSASLRVLAKAVTSLQGTKGDADFGEVKPFFLNPKSIPLNTLYGADDPNTKEWKDGILAVVMRACIVLPHETWKWVVFDGPVDAIWIENMNTVLDNNKKLCLASGEQIKLVNMHTMVFEVEDLSVASPATVSRCGMVFMEPKQLGWRPLFDSWINSLSYDKKFAKLDLKLVEDITSVVEWLVPTLLEGVKRNTKATIPTSAIHQVVSFTRIFGCMLANALKKDDKIKGGLAAHIENMILFALVWSFGCTTNTEGRLRFNQYFMEVLDAKVEGKRGIKEEYKERKAVNGFPCPLPKGDEPPQKTCFDFLYDPEKGWLSWFDTQKKFTISEEMQFHQMLVPTIETISAAWVTDILIKHGHNILLAGDTGTGKSVVVTQKLLVDLKKSPFIPIMLSFSARTSAAVSQDIIDGKLDRRRIGVIGPPPGRRAVVFIDDLNMPQKEEYGAQPPVELMRQWLDYGGWYDRETNTFKKLVDIQMMAAMGPPGGGRNDVSYRMTRHFHSICLNPYSDSSLSNIFSTILAHSFQNYSGKVSSLRKQLVDATISLYSQVTTKLLPTPTKSHYTFNLRDVSKVFQGVVSSDPDMCKEGVDIMSLWIHESRRIFCDRLVNEADIATFEEIISGVCKNQFGSSAKDIVGQDEEGKIEPLIFANFSDPKSVKKPYVRIEDIPQLNETVYGYLEDYNNIEKTKMNLVMFTAAIEHISRVSRIICTPFGNALLVGVGGSGRQSLSRLAAFICEMDVCQVEITKTYNMLDWREDLRQVMIKAGCKDKAVVFLFTDSQIKDETFVEDINAILNNGEVPNLFAADEKMPIIEEVMPAARAAGQSATNNDVFNFFISRCRVNLHVVLCFSPIGDAFRRRLRMFPALVNCCTIDWFHPWPTDALKNVATRFFKDIDLDDSVKNGVVNVCVDMQERVKGMSVQFYETMRRYNYVTPTSYLNLIKIFINIFEDKRSTISAARDRYLNGLAKLAETETQVTDMQAQLVEMQPKLVQASKETDELIVVVEAESEKAEAKKTIVAADEAECNKQAAEANAIKAECEAGLAEAMPALDSAMKALNILKPAQITELKMVKVPTEGVRLVMEALCCIMGVKPDKVGEVGKKTDDYWGPAKKHLLSDSKLLDKIKNFDKDNMPEKVVARLSGYVKNPNFSYEVIAKASDAALGFCKWITAMEIYDRISKVIAPKRAALKKAEDALEAATSALTIKKAELKEVTDKLNALNAQLQEAKDKKERLANEVDVCGKRLIAAEQLIGGLSGEKGRWNEKANQLGKDYDNVVGNIIISSGVIAYLGVFEITFRKRILEEWVKVLMGENISCDADFKLNKVLGDPVQIREWGIQALPNDDFSIDNAIILTKSLCWGLMIDPQLQANRWIRNMEDDKEQLKVVKQTDDNFIRVLIMAVSVGLPVLVEALGEAIEPALEPLLLRNTFKQGSRDMIILGGETIEYSKDFRLYMTTKLSNPHYPPEASTKVTLINFMVTLDGLEDQMLNKTVAAEHPALEAERNDLIVKSAENQKQLQLIEDKILQSMRDSTGNILDDKDLIATLAKSKEASLLIEKRVIAAAKTQEVIEKTRGDYKNVAYMISVMFFCISDLANVDPMYQYSLEWFIILYLKSIKDADPSKDVKVRTKNIQETFQLSLYNNICRSLFEMHKLFFAFHLCIRILQAHKEIDPAELRFLLTGAGGSVGRAIPENPCDDFDFGGNQEVDASLLGKWLPQGTWEEVSNLGQVPSFQDFDTSFTSKQKLWRAIFESADPWTAQLPAPWEKKVNNFQRLCIIRALRPDKVVPAIREVVKVSIGEAYTQPPPFDLNAAFADSSCTAPLIFVLSPGVDPVGNVVALGQQMGFSGDRLFSISMGQGQGVFAEAAIKEAVEKGTWVLLQNCHLLVSWLPTLQKIVEDLDPANTNPDFRLWLTSMPSPDFPVPVLQNGIKMTNEPPKGLKANIAETYRTQNDEWFQDCSKPDVLRKMFFSLAFFHAVCLERRKFGPLGWNIKYQWTNGDRDISKTQLKIFLDLYDELPVKALRYVFGELNYGGRVTDEWDTRAVNCILTDYINTDVLQAGYAYDSKGLYSMPLNGTDIDGYREMIATLPEDDSIEVFGMHDNVNISAAISDTAAIFSTLNTVQPRTTGGAGGSSLDDVVMELTKGIAAQIPANYNIEDAEERYPVMYENSMNTILVQELIRFNKLISVIRKSLTDVQMAIKGEVVMSAELEAMANSMFIGKVPKLWHKVAYPSLKPLSSWVVDLLARLEMYNKWLERGSPANYWISGFFFTQSFLTGTLQNYARKTQIPIDELAFDFEVRPELTPDHDEPPEDGCYIWGLFLDGARFKDGYLSEPMKRQLNSIMPTVWLKPRRETDIPKDRSEYSCPLYKTSERFGVLSTTGRSTNFVCIIKIPSREPEKHWIKRGVALLTQKELA